MGRRMSGGSFCCYGFYLMQVSRLRSDRHYLCGTVFFGI